MLGRKALSPTWCISRGHSSPGVYARSFLEGRLTEEQLDHFRNEVDGNGLPSYPHPWLMPGSSPPFLHGVRSLGGLFTSSCDEVLAQPRADQYGAEGFSVRGGWRDWTNRKLWALIALAGREKARQPHFRCEL